MQVGFRHFKWLNRPSAWQDMQQRRQRRGAAIQQHLDMMNSINTALTSAQQNQISGAASNAAHAALSRVQAQGKAQSAEITKQIDSAQSVLSAAQASTGVDTVA